MCRPELVVCHIAPGAKQRVTGCNVSLHMKLVIIMLTVRDLTISHDRNDLVRLRTAYVLFAPGLLGSKEVDLAQELTCLIQHGTDRDIIDIRTPQFKKSI